jgi:GNAT superfamily N-acetyltransferase
VPAVAPTAGDQEAHWYVETFATAPEFQGQRYGKRLMEWVLSVVDADGVEAYLETYGPRNIQFYESMGWATVDVFQSVDPNDPEYPVLNMNVMLRPPTGQSRL